VQTYLADLTTHHHTLASLRDLADASARCRCEQRHANVNEMTRVLQDDAEIELRHLRGIIRQWEEFVRVFTGERDWLSQLASQQQAAFVAARGTTALHELNSISRQYHDMQQSFVNRKSSMIQVCTVLLGDLLYMHQ